MSGITITPATSEPITIDPCDGPPIKVELIAGIPGPPGPPGKDGSELANFPIAISGPQSGDLLKFNGSAWTNEPSADLVDGGNF